MRSGEKMARRLSVPFCRFPRGGLPPPQAIPPCCQSGDPTRPLWSRHICSDHWHHCCDHCFDLYINYYLYIATGWSLAKTRPIPCKTPCNHGGEEPESWGFQRFTWKDPRHRLPSQQHFQISLPCQDHHDIHKIKEGAPGTLFAVKSVLSRSGLRPRSRL